MNKQGCHIANMTHTVFMPNGHTDAAFVHIYQNTANCSSYAHIITKYVSETNMPLKCHIHQLVHVHETSLFVYIPQMDSIQYTVSPQALLCIHFTLLAYAREQICLPHIRFMFNCTTTVVYIQTTKYKFIYHDISICANNKYDHQMPYISQISLLLNVQIGDNCVSIYTSFELSAINNVTRGTGIHTFHNTDICSWTNMPATLHKYVTLCFYCSLHIDPILLHISIKN